MCVFADIYTHTHIYIYIVLSRHISRHKCISTRHKITEHHTQHRNNPTLLGCPVVVTSPRYGMWSVKNGTEFWFEKMPDTIPAILHPRKSHEFSTWHPNIVWLQDDFLELIPLRLSTELLRLVLSHSCSSAVRPWSDVCRFFFVFVYSV